MNGIKKYIETLDESIIVLAKLRAEKFKHRSYKEAEYLNREIQIYTGVVNNLNCLVHELETEDK